MDLIGAREYVAAALLAVLVAMLLALPLAIVKGLIVLLLVAIAAVVSPVVVVAVVVGSVAGGNVSLDAVVVVVVVSGCRLSFGDGMPRRAVRFLECVHLASPLIPGSCLCLQSRPVYLHIDVH